MVSAVEVMGFVMGCGALLALGRWWGGASARGEQRARDVAEAEKLRAMADRHEWEARMRIEVESNWAERSGKLEGALEQARLGRDRAEEDAKRARRQLTLSEKETGDLAERVYELEDKLRVTGRVVELAERGELADYVKPKGGRMSHFGGGKERK